MSFTLSLNLLVSYLISSCVQVHSQKANKHYVLCLSKKTSGLANRGNPPVTVAWVSLCSSTLLMLLAWFYVEPIVPVQCVPILSPCHSLDRVFSVVFFN